MIENTNPDPDKILKAIQSEENKEKTGQLKIFFGMAAGVGKTSAMLQEAHEKLKEGITLAVGTVNTHGRIETEALVKGLPIIPEKWITFKDKAFSELDIDGILKSKPDLVLIDELAHTNVPGSKHLKRWQDVIEILDAGINVYTTLNVQHLESRKEIVESISGIVIHETVPDLVLERASAFEIIDIPPSELLKRLKEGKVYLGDQSRIAIQNFFQEDRLTALREIALRFTAEKVDHDLHEMMLFGKGWKTRERLMVGVTPALTSLHLIRATRKFAFELDAPWFAVYVDTGIKLCDEDKKKLNTHLQLAQELGAHVIVSHDIDVASALQNLAKQHNITRLIIGRSSPRTFLQNIFRNSLIDRLERHGKQMDILILRQDKLTGIYQKKVPSITLKSPLTSYLLSGLTVFLITLAGLQLTPWIGYCSVGHIFLLGILLLSLFVGIGPILLAATFSALSWDYFFISPSINFLVYSTSDKLLLISYFFAALIVGVLNTRIREKDFLLSRREKKIEMLFAITDEILKSHNLQDLRVNINKKLKQLFGGECDILIKGIDGNLNFEGSLNILKEETDQAAALWCFRNSKTSGKGTDTLPSAKASFFPIKGQSMVGVLAYYHKSNALTLLDKEHLTQFVTDRLGSVIERYLSQETEQYSSYTHEVEKLHNAIFHSLSKGFFTPLDNIFAINRKWLNIASTQETRALALHLNKAAKNLKFIVDNILMISKLESGFITFNKQKYRAEDLISECLQDMKDCTDDHSFIVSSLPEKLILSCDKELLKIAINNVLMNAANYSPSQSPIHVEVALKDDFVDITILDEGPGIPEEFIPLIFEKFYRIPNTKEESIGLGLAIVKAVIDLHEGQLKVQKRDIKGTAFSILLPI